MAPETWGRIFEEVSGKAANSPLYTRDAQRESSDLIILILFFFVALRLGDTGSEKKINCGQTQIGTGPL